MGREREMGKRGEAIEQRDILGFLLETALKCYGNSFIEMVSFISDPCMRDIANRHEGEKYGYDA